MNNEKIRLLFYKYFNELTTDDENRELAELLQQNNLEPEIHELMKEAWENFHSGNNIFSQDTSDKILDQILNETEEEAKESSPFYNRTRWNMAAAVAAILLCFGAITYFQTAKLSPDTVKELSEDHDISPGSSKAFLTLADGSNIVLDSATQGLLTTEGNTRIFKAEGDRLSYQVTSTGKETKPAFNTLRTPRGGQYHLVLPDGTNVWLNAASSIMYPVQFTGDTRQVSIEGEVFFEVEPLFDGKSKVPFVVSTDEVAIEVLGTRFNVNAYKDENDTKTTLLEGSVKVRTQAKTSLLVPGQQASVNASSPEIRIGKANTDQAIAWKNGYFHFQQASIQEIMRQLSKWYDVDVRFVGQKLEKKFSGEIPRSATLLQVLEILEISQVRPKIVNNEIIIET